MKKMSTILKVGLALALLTIMASAAMATTPRLDAIWARTALDSIHLDGVLDEADWAQAETYVVDYGVDAGIPGSGWKTESGWNPTDPTHATFKFLVRNNQLYMGAVVMDKSIGGSAQFNRFDGLLMGLKDHSADYSPKPVAEYFYSWWHDELIDPQPEGTMPSFIGSWAELPHGAPRTAEQIANWDAVTVVNGTTNTDAVDDVGYTVEMRFNLTPMGYDVTQPGGDVVEWNVSVYDCDWFWPINVNSFSSNRVWWQGPWGNAAWYNEVRIFASPDVTTASGAVPDIGPEMVIQNIDSTPVIDGKLDDAVWTDPDIYSFDIRWNPDTLVDTYDGVGPYRAGQFQPTVNGNVALVIDPGDATVKVYHRGDMLYMGFEAHDRVVQYHPDLNRWDGFIVTIDDRAQRDSDNQLLTRRLSFQVGADGNAVAQDDLLSLVTSGNAEVAVDLMAGTTVDTLGTQADTGYTAEMAIDLTSLGYPTGLGDGAFFFGVVLMDGDSFIPITDSYGTRSWWYREFPGECCPTWAELESSVSAVPDPTGTGDIGYATLTGGSGPSPQPDIRFAMPERNLVTLEVFDVRGRLIERRGLGEMAAGENGVSIFTSNRTSAGVYMYRLRMADPLTGIPRGVLSGKVLLIK